MADAPTGPIARTSCATQKLHSGSYRVPRPENGSAGFASPPGGAPPFRRDFRRTSQDLRGGGGSAPPAGGPVRRRLSCRPQRARFRSSLGAGGTRPRGGSRARTQSPSASGWCVCRLAPPPACQTGGHGRCTSAARSSPEIPRHGQRRAADASRGVSSPTRAGVWDDGGQPPRRQTLSVGRPPAAYPIARRWRGGRRPAGRSRTTHTPRDARRTAHLAAGGERGASGPPPARFAPSGAGGCAGHPADFFFSVAPQGAAEVPRGPLSWRAFKKGGACARAARHPHRTPPTSAPRPSCSPHAAVCSPVEPASSRVGRGWRAPHPPRLCLCTRARHGFCVRVGGWGHPAGPPPGGRDDGPPLAGRGVGVPGFPQEQWRRRCWGGGDGCRWRRRR